LSFGNTLDALKRSQKGRTGGSASLSFFFTSNFQRIQRTMVHYELTFTVPSPGSCTAFVEFSPSGRFLAVGDRDSSLLYILDRRAGFHPNLSVVAPTKPTALVWETPQTFYVGLGDGRFIHYRIDLKGMKVVVGVANHMFRGAFPITAMALDTKSKTLVLSVGPGVFAFRRVRTTSIFRLLMVWTSALTFLKVNFASSPPYQAVSTFQATLEVRGHPSRSLFVSLPTIHSSLHFPANT
jgi:hypothetical protein